MAKKLQTLQSAIQQTMALFGPDILKHKQSFLNAIEDLVPYLEDDCFFLQKTYDDEIGRIIYNYFQLSSLSDDIYIEESKSYLLDKLGLNNEKINQFISYFLHNGDTPTKQLSTSNKVIVESEENEENKNQEPGKSQRFETTIISDNHLKRTNNLSPKKKLTKAAVIFCTIIVIFSIGCAIIRNTKALDSLLSTSYVTWGIFQDYLGKYDNSFFWYEKSAQANNAKGMNYLGCAYYYGHGTNQDYDKAFYWYEKSAEASDTNGMCNLGIMYKNGLGTDQDYEKAFYWYKKSAKAHNATGMNDLGTAYYSGQGTKQDYEKAFYWYEKSAEAGNDNGMCNLGIIYENGFGTDQDYEKAFYWYKKSAKAHNATGMNYLGTAYYYGQGTKQDYEKAFYWYEKSAEADNAKGMRNLGRMYEINKDYENAEYWYKNALKAGFADAEEDLKRLNN